LLDGHLGRVLRCLLVLFDRPGNIMHMERSAQLTQQRWRIVEYPMHASLLPVV